MKKTDTSIIIVPHTHWDREWYEPFQAFRYKLVKLIDTLIEIMEHQDYYFMLDGQTIVLEDYFEIRPENREKVLGLIRRGNLAIGPWYLLPDEWLVGEENLVRNLELSYKLAKEMDIPVMKVAYLPDQFGHSQVIPQFLADITDIRSVVLWRGVGPEVTTVPFNWKPHKNSPSSILGVYLPHGYGNAAALPETATELQEEIGKLINNLQPFSPLPVYLLMNGTDHQFPVPAIQTLLPEIETVGETSLGLLHHFIEKLQEAIDITNYTPPEYIGEFRSSARAPLLQDTYSARMWIKQWNQRCEDLLVNYAEPLSAYLSFYNLQDYPTSFLDLAWKWLLKNAPHDSICGCSIDQTHDEMKPRFSWSESIARQVIDERLQVLRDRGEETGPQRIDVFNHTNSKSPQLVEFRISSKIPVAGLRSEDGEEYIVQPTSSSEEIVLDENMSPTMVKTGIRMLPGRKLMDFYINDVTFFDGTDPNICEVRLTCGDTLVGDLEIKELKQRANDLVDSKKYQRFHIIASKGTEQGYNALVPLNPWEFTRLSVLEEIDKPSEREFKIDKRQVRNRFYDLKFNKDGSISLFDKTTSTQYKNLHVFEDTGDRGDLYTFGRVEPSVYKTSKVTRKIITKGPIFHEIEQTLELVTFRELEPKREKRKGKVKIPIQTVFRFYADLPRIDIETTLTNHASNHRLRVGFNLPFDAHETITSTHFGVVRRRAQPSREGEFVERPSGIQAQKRFIRVQDSNAALTLINKGLPEVELDNNTLSLTLLRSVGHLSRSDFDERPIHAGPAMETPGGQELGESYTYHYSLVTHSADEDITYSADQSELYSLPASSVVRTGKADAFLEPVFMVDNPLIRISSFRKIEGAIVLTLYNLAKERKHCTLSLHPTITKCFAVNIGGRVKREYTIKESKLGLQFQPMEILMLKLEY
jgi:alpha-mannosidase